MASDLTLKEWVENQLYAELLRMPLWTDAAFGTLAEGQVLTNLDPRYDLIIRLVTDHLNKAPLSLYDAEFRHIWKVTDFLPCVKAAVAKVKAARHQN